MMIRVIVTDIEGTTSSIAFVHEVLFPYAREHMGEFVREWQHEDATVAEQLDVVAQVSGADRDDVDALIRTLDQWIDEDRKETSLKTLQGMLSSVLRRFPIERVILVADRGLLSMENIGELTALADRFRDRADAATAGATA